MCWGFICGKLSASALKVTANPFLLLFLGALPDVDLLLGIVGIQHRTWTHSILIWTLVFTPFLAIYRQRAIPYFVATIQHILIGDFIVGAYNRPFWPVSQSNFNLGYSLFSIENIALEAAGLGLMIALILLKKPMQIEFFFESKLILILPLIMLVTFLFFVFSYDWIADVLVDLRILKETRLLDSVPGALQHPMFPVAVALHIILIGILLTSLVNQVARRARPRIKG
jgi:membrane-bound metal-dependent hydrolase YbcI (DUF457 family)